MRRFDQTMGDHEYGLARLELGHHQGSRRRSWSRFSGIRSSERLFRVLAKIIAALKAVPESFASCSSRPGSDRTFLLQDHLLPELLDAPAG